MRSGMGMKNEVLIGTYSSVRKNEIERISNDNGEGVNNKE